MQNVESPKIHQYYFRRTEERIYCIECEDCNNSDFALYSKNLRKSTVWVEILARIKIWRFLPIYDVKLKFCQSRKPHFVIKQHLEFCQINLPLLHKTPNFSPAKISIYTVYNKVIIITNLSIVCSWLTCLLCQV